jgi:RNA polymerase sigma factor (sigma-70 family)
MRPADEHYINAIRNNDRKGLQQLYQEFLPRISAFIRKNGGKDADAKDVFQDALIVIFKKVQEADFQLTSGFYTLLYGICRNLWGNRLQKKSGNEVSIPEDYKYTGEAGLSQLLEQQEEEQIFWDAFRQLGQDCQQLLQWFFAKVKMAEIAERMEYSSVGYAKKRKFQCKEQLIQRVKADARYSELMNN